LMKSLEAFAAAAGRHIGAPTEARAVA
jgi:hypothetical protein